MSEVDEMSAASRGSQPVAWAVIDDEGVQHSLWFLEKDATAEAAMVGGGVVPLCRSPTLTDEERAFLTLHAERLVGWARSSPESARELETVRGMLERL